MAYNAIKGVQAFNITNIDGTALNATTNILTVPSNVRFYPSLLILEVNTVNALIAVSSISFGASSSYNSLLAATPLTSMSAANNMLGFTFNTINSSVSPGAVLGLKITTAATGTGGLAYTLNCILQGAFF